MSYQNPLVIKLEELHQKYAVKLDAAGGMAGMMWKMVSSSIPDILSLLDQDVEKRQKLEYLIKDLADIIK